MTRPVEIVARLDTKGLDVWRNRKLIRALTAAASKAGSETIRKLRTEASRTVRSKKKIRAGAVRKGLPIFFPRSKKDLDSLIWRLDVSGQLAPVISYPGVRQTKKGVSVRINTSGARKLIPSAFVATMPNGHRGVFRKTTKAGPWRRGAQGQALPIEELFTSRVVDVFNDAGVVPGLQRMAGDAFGSAFVRVFPLEAVRVKSHTVI